MRTYSEIGRIWRCGCFALSILHGGETPAARVTEIICPAGFTYVLKYVSDHAHQGKGRGQRHFALRHIDGKLHGNHHLREKCG